MQQKITDKIKGGFTISVCEHRAHNLIEFAWNTLGLNFKHVLPLLYTALKSQTIYLVPVYNTHPNFSYHIFE